MRRFSGGARFARRPGLMAGHGGWLTRMLVVGLTVGLGSVGLPLFDAIVPVAPAAAAGTGSIVISSGTTPTATR